MILELSGFFLAQQLGTVDSATGTLLIQEVHNRSSQGEMLVHLPVHAAEGFPTAVEVEGIGQIGIQVGHSFKGGLDEIVVISRLLVSEQGVQVETFERIDFCRSSPAQGLDVVY